MNDHRVRANIAAGRVSIGMMLGDPLAAGMPASDFAVVDLELGVADLRAAVSEIRASAITEPLVRLSPDDPEALPAVLASGASGIIIPLVGGIDAVRAAGSEAHAETLVVAEIGSATGIANLDAIAALPRVEVLFVTPCELALDLGVDYAGAWPRTAGPLADAIAQVPSVARRFGKAAGFQASSTDVASTCIGAGYALVCLTAHSIATFRARRRSGLQFDARHHVSTEKLLYPERLDPESYGERLPFAVHYEPAPLSEIDRLLDALTLAPEETTFVDVGAGLGRVVLRAATRPFRAVVGVEISGTLAEAAQTNVRAYRGELRCRDVRVVRNDALAFPLPDGDLAVFLNNPFSAEILAPFVDRLAEPAGRAVTILYWSPQARSVLDAHPAFALDWEYEMALAYRLR